MGDLSRSSGDRPDMGEIAAETWAVAEETAEEVVRCVHPTLDTEEKRKDVIEFIQRLIRDNLDVEVFPYGSVPLKTYLPDGDVDLTAFCSPTAMDTLAHSVRDVLHCAENKEDTEYKVKDTQFINAEVKLVKCLVQNIVVDLSFNQLGGLCTLRFLEQVDSRVGKNHLFKRSIILVKTWCYYESRILGARHGLISTYAMETLVLYIFHLFHAMLDGPFAVLHKFLDYFSKFDWDNYCISLDGPVRKSRLPEIVVDMDHSVQNDDLLNKEFLRNCIDMFSVPFRETDTSLKEFPTKYLNIIDPLKETNNLGRSVNRGNFYRIRSAFRYGARKLGKIFMLPRDKIGDEIKRFFGNTFERHGRTGENCVLSSRSSSFSEERIQFISLSLGSESNTANGNFEVDYCTEINPIPMALQMGQSMRELGISGSRPVGEMNWRPLDYQLNSSASAWYPNDSVSQYYNPQSQYSQSFAENGAYDNWVLNEGNSVNMIPEKADNDLFTGEQRDNHFRPSSLGCYHSDNYKHLSNFSSIMSPNESISEDLGLDLRDRDLVDVLGSPENSNPLSDLSGDYDSHIRSLFYGQCCLVDASSDPLRKHPLPTFASQFESKKPWKATGRSNSMTYYSSSDLIDNRLVDNGVNLGWATEASNVHEPSNRSLCVEEKQNKPRGTGTYIPNGCPYMEMPSQARGRYHEPGHSRKYQRTRSFPMVPHKSSDEGGTSHEQQLSKGACNGEETEILASAVDDKSQSCDSVFNLEKVEFGSLGNLSDGSTLRASENSSGWCSINQVKSSESLFVSNHERAGNKLYRLKDEDSPPLDSLVA